MSFCLRGIHVGTTEDLRFQGFQAGVEGRAGLSVVSRQPLIPPLLESGLHHSLADGVSLSPDSIRNELACFPLVSDPLFE